MKNTINYNLKKPDITDKVNIQDINDNMNIVDKELKDLSSLAIENQSRISDLAGAGRTTETIKNNADRINQIEAEPYIDILARQEVMEIRMKLGLNKKSLIGYYDLLNNEDGVDTANTDAAFSGDGYKFGEAVDYFYATVEGNFTNTVDVRLKSATKELVVGDEFEINGNVRTITNLSRWDVEDGYDVTFNDNVTLTDGEIINSVAQRDVLTMKDVDFSKEVVIGELSNYKSILLNLYPKEVARLITNGNYTNTNSIKILKSDKVKQNDKLLIKGAYNKIISITDFYEVIDKTTAFGEVVEVCPYLEDYPEENINNIVSDSKDNLYVVYSYDNQVYCRKSVDGGNTWVDMKFPQIVDRYNITPYMVIDKSDNLHVAWNSDNEIFYSKFDGILWSNPINIQDSSEFSQYQPSIAIDSQDNLHVVWYGKDSINTENYQIKYSKFNGISWTPWINIQEISGYIQYRPAIAIDSKDNLHVVWRGKDSVNTEKHQIKYSKFNGTIWSDWINVKEISGYSQYEPAIAIDSNDNIHVIWSGSDSNSSIKQIKYSKFDGASWSSWINIQPYHHKQYSPNVGIDIDDNLHVVWYGTDDSNTSFSQIKYSRFDGIEWSPWEAITTGRIDHQQYPSICKTIKKDFEKPLIVWQDNQENKMLLYGKWTAYNGYNIILENPVNLLDRDELYIVNLFAKQDIDNMTLKAIDNEKFIYSITDLKDAIVKIRIRGENVELDKILYSLA